MCQICQNAFTQDSTFKLSKDPLSWFSVKWKNEALPLATRSNDGFG
jgi:hypothetical protein